MFEISVPTCLNYVPSEGLPVFSYLWRSMTLNKLWRPYHRMMHIQQEVQAWHPLVDHILSTQAIPTNEYILDCLHQSMQGFSLRPEQEMSASHRNMYYDGISYTALDLCAPWVLVQEACLQMKRQGTVHLVKHIHLLVVLGRKKNRQHKVRDINQ